MRDGVPEPPWRMAEMDGGVSRLWVGMHLWSQVCLMHERALFVWDTGALCRRFLVALVWERKNSARHKQVIIKTPK